MNSDLSLRVNVLLRKVAGEIALACVFYSVLRIPSWAQVWFGVCVYAYTQGNTVLCEYTMNTETGLYLRATCPLQQLETSISLARSYCQITLILYFSGAEIGLCVRCSVFLLITWSKGIGFSICCLR